MAYTITTQKELRASFWRDNPQCSRRTIPDYSGIGRMHCTDTRVAWCDYVDSLQCSGLISADLANRATLEVTPRLFEWQLQGDYGQGFECECAESTFSEARARLREYRENGPGVYRIRRAVVKG